MGDIPAGTYHFVLDCIVMSSVDVSFALEWRVGGDTVVLSHWTKHFEPLAGGTYDAQRYETNRAVSGAANFEAGAQLVFRYSASSSSSSMAWVPNGDGAIKDGRIPNITLPL